MTLSWLNPFVSPAGALQVGAYHEVFIDIIPMVFNELSYMCHSNPLKQTCYVVVV